MQTLDQVTQPESGLKAKVVMKQRLVARELAYRLRLVALGQVHLDETGAGAFPEWVCPHGSSSGAGGFTAAASGRQAAGQPRAAAHPQLGSSSPGRPRRGSSWDLPGSAARRCGGEDVEYRLIRRDEAWTARIRASCLP
jgi:hypothetical protein